MLWAVAPWRGRAYGIRSPCVLDFGMRPLATDTIIKLEINNQILCKLIF